MSQIQEFVFRTSPTTEAHGDSVTAQETAGYSDVFLHGLFNVNQTDPRVGDLVRLLHTEIPTMVIRNVLKPDDRSLTHGDHYCVIAATNPTDAEIDAALAEDPLVVRVKPVGPRDSVDAMRHLETIAETNNTWSATAVADFLEKWIVSPVVEAFAVIAPSGYLGGEVHVDVFDTKTAKVEIVDRFIYGYYTETLGTDPIKIAAVRAA